MKFVVAFLALFLAIAMAQELQDLESVSYDPEWWPHYPPHPIPPTHPPHFNHAAKKCHKAIHNPDLVACMHDLQTYWKTHKITISPDCCSAMTKIHKVCPIFKARHPFVGKLIKHHCHATSPSPT